MGYGKKYIQTCARDTGAQSFGVLVFIASPFFYLVPSGRNYRNGRTYTQRYDSRSRFFMSSLSFVRIFRSFPVSRGRQLMLSESRGPGMVYTLASALMGEERKRFFFSYPLPQPLYLIYAFSKRAQNMLPQGRRNVRKVMTGQRCRSQRSLVLIV